ncbi:hypothetical protein GEOBRER4_n1362 [Citrifermentans bremense]|uniref:Helix-turn-helix domain-containing protein n=1 Tax=Citrifermentans bremense TaxID=60035 RepID=A0A6S6M4H8_9BACT|nr:MULTISPECIES: hypothetical protein [Geobacteraceae]BCG46561.1 hypothetical protein GEOBRER4_n1362 [Citrifermentans bremense]
MKNNTATKETQAKESVFITPEQLALRWHCARTSVDRIVRRENLSRVCLGTGKNGMVRFLLKEILDYEASRTVQA